MRRLHLDAATTGPQRGLQSAATSKQTNALEISTRLDETTMLRTEVRAPNSARRELLGTEVCAPDLLACAHDLPNDASASETKRRLPQPPYNPGVRDLVEGKRAWDVRASLATQKRGFRGWHERGYLPHRDAPGLTQFITYHLADSFPSELLGEWAALLKIEEERQRRKELEAYLDRGRGQCWLRRPQIAAICEQAFLDSNHQRYLLKAWCLMPNHVHLLDRANGCICKKVEGRHGARM